MIVRNDLFLLSCNVLGVGENMMLKPRVFMGKSKSVTSFQTPCLQDLFLSKGHTVNFKKMLTVSFKKMEKSLSQMIL